MSLTVDHGRIRTEKFPGDPGRVGNDKEGVSGGVGLQSHAIDQDADNVENRWFLDYYDDDEKNLPEPCEREWRTREKVDCVHGVSEKIIVQPLRMCSVFTQAELHSWSEYIKYNTQLGHGANTISI